MLKDYTEIRVRYSDTDQMNFVYNGKYLEYFEVGRTEMLRNIGFPYSLIEEKGFQLPVIEAFIKFINPAFYDEILIVESEMKEFPSFKLHIDYKVFKKTGNQLAAEGYTKHVFINTGTKKVVRPPEFFFEKIKSFYQDKDL
ncbi:MAG TPA: thioesterase family protein [Ignavibacteriaceae bacterium]|nr:thioesterase family protein [Ignavibacteriaceae bacterium]